MISYFEVDVNCPTCFNTAVEALLATDGVGSVEAHAAQRCLSVRHNVDPEQLRDIIRRVGHTLETADNGEFVMGAAHVGTAHHCDRHRRRSDHV